MSEGDPTAAEGVRLQKVLAQAGVGSRRRCEELMARGHVSVNGEITTQMGVRVDPIRDVVHVDGRRIPPPSEHAYVVLNKPASYTGHTLLCEDVLLESGVTDLSVRLLPIGDTRDELIASKYRTREVIAELAKAV